jgi:hypothetical protein
MASSVTSPLERVRADPGVTDDLVEHLEQQLDHDQFDLNRNIDAAARMC